MLLPLRVFWLRDNCLDIPVKMILRVPSLPERRYMRPNSSSLITLCFCFFLFDHSLLLLRLLLLSLSSGVPGVPAQVSRQV